MGSKVTVVKGARVYGFNRDNWFDTRRDYEVELIQFKLGFAYYRANGDVFKTAQSNIKERANGTHSRRRH